MAEAVFSLPYDMLLNVSVVVHVPIKLFSMHIVYRYSPSNMGAMPYFILNMLAWDLLGNFFRALLHNYPVFPAVCSRAYGPIILVTDNELVYHFLFASTIACVVNCAVTSLNACPYRYAVFIFPKHLKRVKRSWAVAFFAVIYTGYTIVTFVVYWFFTISSEDYDFEKKPEDTRRLFCFQPRGW
uniref:G_PROTEIN_RECEP_F1_2 domain-containing protein n=1 Tax=Steinernema glaseri TaxID=37863 RepID=A0A1I7ZGZ9_9BILA